MEKSVIVELKGHIIDSLTLPKVLDLILEGGARCEVLEIKVGIEKTENSYARLKVMAKDQNILSAVIEKLTKQGVNVLDEQTVSSNAAL